MTSQNQNPVDNFADAPQPYGSDEGAPDIGMSDRFKQGQQGQETWNTDTGAYVNVTYNTSSNTNSSDTSQGRDVPTSSRIGEHPPAGDQSEVPEGRESTQSTSPPYSSQGTEVPSGHRVGEYSFGGDQSGAPFPGAASGAPGGGGSTESSTQQTQTPSSFEKVPGTPSWGSQRADVGTGTGAQYNQSDPKAEPGASTQVGGERTGQAGTTADVGGAAASGTAETTTAGSGPKGLKNIASSVHVSLYSRSFPCPRNSS